MKDIIEGIILHVNLGIGILLLYLNSKSNNHRRDTKAETDRLVLPITVIVFFLVFILGYRDFIFL